jgi:multiple sugar transport system substrate-binding protein
MKRAFRVLIFASLIMISIILYYLSHNFEGDSGVKKIYFADNISSAHQSLIEKFNHEFEGRIEVYPVNLPFSKFSTNERKELLARSLRSKSDRIDLLAVDLIWVPRFSRWAETMDMYFPVQQRNSIIPNAIESCYFNGQLVGFPFYIDVGLMYYRKDLLQKLSDYPYWEKKIQSSLTWQELLTLSKRIHSPQGFSYIFAADNYEGLVCSFLDLLMSQESSIMMGDSLTLVTEPAIRSLQLLVDLVNKYKITPPVVTSFDEYQEYLYALRYDIPFLRGWPGAKIQYRHTIENGEKLNLLEFAPLPHFEGAKRTFVLGGWNLMIPRYSHHKAEAVEFIKFILRPENQELLYQQGGFIPVMREVYADSEFIRQNPELIRYQSLIQQGFHRPMLVDYTKISDAISYYSNLAIKGDLPVREALRRATETINQNRAVIKKP